MSIKLLTEHRLEFLSLKRGCTEARLNLHMSKCHIVGNHMMRLKYTNNIGEKTIEYAREKAQSQNRHLEERRQNSCTDTHIK